MSRIATLMMQSTFVLHFTNSDNVSTWRIEPELPFLVSCISSTQSLFFRHREVILFFSWRCVPWPIFTLSYFEIGYIWAVQSNRFHYPFLVRDTVQIPYFKSGHWSPIWERQVILASNSESSILTLLWIVRRTSAKHFRLMRGISGRGLCLLFFFGVAGILVDFNLGKEVSLRLIFNSRCCCFISAIFTWFLWFSQSSSCDIIGGRPPTFSSHPLLVVCPFRAG